MLHRLQCARGFGDWIDSILAFSRSLHSLAVDVPAFACLSALVLITGEWPVLGAGEGWRALGGLASDTSQAATLWSGGGMWRGASIMGRRAALRGGGRAGAGAQLRVTAKPRPVCE